MVLSWFSTIFHISKNPYKQIPILDLLCPPPAPFLPNPNNPTMSDLTTMDWSNLDSQIVSLRAGGTLTEKEVKQLCDAVSLKRKEDSSMSG